MLTQIHAIQAALGKVEQEILHEQLNQCVAHAFHSGDENEKLKMVDEIFDVRTSRSLIEIKNGGHYEP